MDARQRLELVKRKGEMLALPDQGLVVPQPDLAMPNSQFIGSNLIGSRFLRRSNVVSGGGVGKPKCRITDKVYTSGASSANWTVNVNLGVPDTGGRAHTNIIMVSHIEGASSIAFNADTGTELNGVHADNFYALQEKLSTDGSSVRVGDFLFVTYNQDTGVKSCTLNLSSARSGEWYFTAWQVLYDPAFSFPQGFFGRKELNEGTEPNTAQTMDQEVDGYIFGHTTNVNGGAPSWTPSKIDTGNTTEEGVSYFYDFDTSDEAGGAIIVCDTGTTSTFWGNPTSEYISSWCYLSWNAAD